jgi:tripartite-type tricarboxylate transporter receptor subunit TctC
MRKTVVAIVAVMCLVLMSVGGAFAGTYPEKNIKIIVPFAPGGGVDTTCRMIAEVAPKYLGDKKIIVENMPGGGAVIGQTFVSKAKPDGYTILGYTSSVVSNPMTKKTTYTHTSFKPVAMYCFDPEILMVPADSPYKTLEDFIKAGQEKEISVATPGYSTSHHIAALIMEGKLGVKFGYVHNQSAAMQLQQLLGGHVDAGMMAMGEAVSYIKDGSLRALAVAVAERDPNLPDVPTFTEEGFDLEWGAFRGLAVPGDTPDETVKALEQILKEIIADPDYAASMEKAGYPLVYRNGSDFATYVEGVAEGLKKVLPTLNKQ